MQNSKKRKQNKTRASKDIITKSVLKISVILLLVGLNGHGILAIGETISYFSDEENSKKNTYFASTLDFSLRSGQADFIPPAQNMIPGTSTARDIYITKLGELDFKYRAHSEPLDGFCNLDLYNTLQLKVWYNWYDATGTKHMDLKYNGLLKDFDDFDTNPDDPDLRIYNNHPYYPNPFYAENEHWLYFQITLPEDIGNLQNKTCQFKFVFDGWQTEFSDPSAGFSDTEEILNTISTGNWMPEVTVIYPNGGEIWYMVPDNCPDIPACSAWCQQHGMNENCQYPIQWTAINKIGPDMDLWIDIYYSVDSGRSWMAQIIAHTENDGIFWWKIPYDSNYASEHARIKVEAVHKTYSFLTNWDMSDNDFCPPILSLQEILAIQMPPQENSDSQSSVDQTPSGIVVSPQPTSTQDIYEENISDNSVSTDKGSTTTDNQMMEDEPAPATEEESVLVDEENEVLEPTLTQLADTDSTSSEPRTLELEPQNILDIPESDSTSTEEDISEENAQITQDTAEKSQSQENDSQTDKKQDESDDNQTEAQQEEDSQQNLIGEDLALPEENSIIPKPQKDGNLDDNSNPSTEGDIEIENDTSEITE